MNAMFLEKIKGLKDRCVTLNGLRGDPDKPDSKVELRTSIPKWIDDYVAGFDAAKGADLIKAAHGGDRDAQRSLNALRIEQVNNFIWPSLNFASGFFRTVSLAKGDRPVVQNETGKEVRIGFIGEDGSPQSVKLNHPTSETLIPLKYLMSDKYGYRLVDIYNGDVTQAALRNLDVAFDLANKVDKLAFDLLTADLGDGGALGTFVTTGNKVRRVFVPHSRIDTSNLPTTNDIELADNDGDSGFRLAAIRAVMKYVTQWGNAFREGPLFPTGRIFVPSIDAAQLSEEIVPTGTTSNPTANQIMNQYLAFDYMNVRWNIIPDNTIPADKAYFQLNRTVGEIFEKPDLDQSFDEVDQEKNYAERFQKKPFGIYITEPNRVNVVRVTYRT